MLAIVATVVHFHSLENNKKGEDYEACRSDVKQWFNIDNNVLFSMYPPQPYQLPFFQQHLPHKLLTLFFDGAYMCK